jgi:hypothetical protein
MPHNLGSLFTLTNLHQQCDRLHERWDGLFGSLDCSDMLHTARSIPVSPLDLPCKQKILSVKKPISFLVPEQLAYTFRICRPLQTCDNRRFRIEESEMLGGQHSLGSWNMRRTPSRETWTSAEAVTGHRRYSYGTKYRSRFLRHHRGLQLQN